MIFSELGWPACGEIEIAEFAGRKDTDNRIKANPFWDHNGKLCRMPRLRVS